MDQNKWAFTSQLYKITWQRGSGVGPGVHGLEVKFTQCSSGHGGFMGDAWNLPCVLRANGSSLGEGRSRDSRQRKLFMPGVES